MSDTQETAGRPGLERHFQTFMGIIVIGVMSWVGITVAKTNESLARAEVRIEALQGDLADMKQNMSVVSMIELQGDVRGLKALVNSQEERINTIWPRLREIKERVQALEPKGTTRWQY